MGSFDDLIGDIDSGRLRQVLDQELERVVTAVEVQKRQGEITLKLTIRLENNRVVVVPAVTAKAPTEQASASLFFFDGEGGLTREDPRQQVLRGLAPQIIREDCNE